MSQNLAPVAVSSADHVRLMDLYQRGLCLQAYQLSETIGPIPAWTGTDARLLAGRLAIHLGAPRLTYRMHLLAWRQDRTHPEACYYHARALQDRRGSLTAWRFLQRIGELPAEAPANVRSDWLAFHACVLGRFRDFDAAESYLRRAEEVCPDQPWTCLERAFLLELEDRYEESLAACAAPWNCARGIAPACRPPHTRCNCSTAIAKPWSCSTKAPSASRAG